MRLNHHSPLHWFGVTLVALVALFTFGHAHGQNTSASGAFAGRPALVPKKGEIANDVTSPVRRVKKAARRTLQRSRTGLVSFDAKGV